MSVPENHKNWAQHLRTLLGGECAVHNFYDESETNSVHILRSINEEGIVVATVGLMEINQSKNQNIELFTEVLMDQRGHDERIENVLSTIAFYILKDGWRIAPGVVFEQMVEIYFPNHPLPHVIFVPPIPVGDRNDQRPAGNEAYLSIDGGSNFRGRAAVCGQK